MHVSFRSERTRGGGKAAPHLRDPLYQPGSGASRRSGAGGRPQPRAGVGRLGDVRCVHARAVPHPLPDAEGVQGRTRRAAHADPRSRQRSRRPEVPDAPAELCRRRAQHQHHRGRPRDARPDARHRHDPLRRARHGLRPHRRCECGSRNARDDLPAGRRRAARVERRLHGRRHRRRGHRHRRAGSARLRRPPRPRQRRRLERRHVGARLRRARHVRRRRRRRPEPGRALRRRRPGHHDLRDQHPGARRLGVHERRHQRARLGARERRPAEHPRRQHVIRRGHGEQLQRRRARQRGRGPLAGGRRHGRRSGQPRRRTRTTSRPATTRS